MCDLAWVVLSDRVRARALSDRQSVGVAALLSGADVTWPSPEEAVEEFADLIAAEPVVTHISADQARVRALLGIT